MSQFPNARPSRRHAKRQQIEQRCAFKIVQLHVDRSVFRTEVHQSDKGRADLADATDRTSRNGRKWVHEDLKGAQSYEVTGKDERQHAMSLSCPAGRSDRSGVRLHDIGERTCDGSADNACIFEPWLRTPEPARGFFRATVSDLGEDEERYGFETLAVRGVRKRDNSTA